MLNIQRTFIYFLEHLISRNVGVDIIPESIDKKEPKCKEYLRRHLIDSVKHNVCEL